MAEVQRRDETEAQRRGRGTETKQRHRDEAEVQRRGRGTEMRQEARVVP